MSDHNGVLPRGTRLPVPVVNALCAAALWCRFREAEGGSGGGGSGRGLERTESVSGPPHTCTVHCKCRDLAPDSYAHSERHRPGLGSAWDFRMEKLSESFGRSVTQHQNFSSLQPRKLVTATHLSARLPQPAHRRPPSEICRWPRAALLRFPRV